MNSTRVPVSRLSSIRMELFSSTRRKTPGVRSTSARPWSVRSSEPGLMSQTLPNLCSSGWPSMETEPSKKWTRPERTETTGWPDNAAAVERKMIQRENITPPVQELIFRGGLSRGERSRSGVRSSGTGWRRVYDGVELGAWHVGTGAEEVG